MFQTVDTKYVMSNAMRQAVIMQIRRNVIETKMPPVHSDLLMRELFYSTTASVFSVCSFYIFQYCNIKLKKLNKL